MVDETNDSRNGLLLGYYVDTTQFFASKVILAEKKSSKSKSAFAISDRDQKKRDHANPLFLLIHEYITPSLTLPQNNACCKRFRPSLPVLNYLLTVPMLLRC